MAVSIKDDVGLCCSLRGFCAYLWWFVLKTRIKRFLLSLMYNKIEIMAKILHRTLRGEIHNIAPKVPIALVMFVLICSGIVRLGN